MRLWGQDELIYTPYSPQFNPIKQSCSSLKAHLEKIKATTSEQLEQAIATFID
ncbi:MAG: hypothetical protein O4805_10290 [Trichodesmium sp. St16_bin2-tuft]|nr:hypothetical protein [Trichodesmium sp. St16_bin2-tuft]